jgi:predicted acylesterase/phospholipase RssA
MAKAKLEFKNLEYIVMEGGGARGAAYLGAIRALETKMREHQVSNTLEIFKYNTTGRSKPGLLDYYKKDGDIEIPVIKGIAGSSAGAITAFALALGFNSDEIDEILKYPFKNFLQEKDVGKYRMIDENGVLSVGQDKKIKPLKLKN